MIYAHTEQVRHLCASCDITTDATRGLDGSATALVVTGKICAPPNLTPRELLESLDAALRAQPDVRVFAPELAASAGDPARADIDARRKAMIDAREGGA